MNPDDSISILLDLHGSIFEVSPRGYWVKFVVHHVPASNWIPHGITYSLTLHSRKGNRLLGFDNAHSVDATPPNDHFHRDGKDKGHRYNYRSAEMLLSDFWAAVDQYLKEHDL